MSTSSKPAPINISAFRGYVTAVKIICCLFLIASGAIVSVKPAQAADPATVVINELMYHPGSDDENDEFLELHNYGEASVDMSGWCFTNGITLCFLSGTSLDPDEYALISPNYTQTISTYSHTPIGTYTGNLSNSGERIRLVDEELVTVDTVSYKDASPWPLSADGDGPSLELRDPLLDHELASSWGSSLSDGGTPEAINSITNANIPVVSNVSQPQDVESTDDVTITATIENSVTTNLVYKIGFDSDITVSMFDDGTHDDGDADDGVFGAMIPQQDSNALVRFRVEATNGNGTTSGPSSDDTIDYYGYVVDSQTLNETVPILQWFIPDNTYDELNGFDVEDDTYVPCVIAYGNIVFDNSEIRLKGNYSRSFDKKPYKVKLPQGHTIDIDGISKYPVNEFHLNPDYANGNSYVLSTLSWKIYEYAGFPVPNFGKLQVNRNGDFEGTYLFSDKYDSEWKDENPTYKNQEHYDNWWEKQSPKDGDFSARNNWETNELTLTGDELRDYVLDNNDIPNLINYMAATAVARHHDWSSKQNLQEFRDTNGTGRWSIQPWDLDLTFTNIGFDGTTEAEPGSGYMIDPHDSPDYLPVNDRFMVNVIYDDPELRSMYQRRVRTLVDELYVTGLITQWADDTIEHLEPAMLLDEAKWGSDPNMQAYFDAVIDYMSNDLGLDINDPEVIAMFYMQGLGITDLSIFPDPITAIEPLSLKNRLFLTFNLQVPKMAQAFTNQYVTEGYLPTTEPANPVVNINEVMYNPVDGNSQEYIELYNPNNYAVDLSQWTIEGIDFELPGGSTLPAHGYGIIVKNDAASRAHYGGGVLVLGQYSGTLADGGETISLVRDNDTVSSTIEYSTDQPWPSGANGNGKSLARDIDSGCWGVSSNNDGTPGEENSLDEEWTSSNAGVLCPFVEEPPTTTTVPPPTTTASPTTTVPDSSATPTTQPVKATTKKSSSASTSESTTTPTTTLPTTSIPNTLPTIGKASSNTDSEQPEVATEQAIKSVDRDSSLPLALPIAGVVLLGSAAGLFFFRPRWLMSLFGKNDV